MVNSETKRVLFLKNRTVPEDNYEVHFRNNGFDPVFVPLIKHTNQPEELLNLLQKPGYLEELEHVIITSQRSIECLNADVIPKLALSVQQELFNKTVYAVGPATQEFLTKSGFTDVRGGSETGNGELLSDFIIGELLGDCNASGLKPILYLVGEIRKDTIRRRLSTAGLVLKEVVTYKTAVLDNNLDNFKNAVIDGAWVVVFSPQGTQELLESMRSSKLKIASIGPTTEQFLLKHDVPVHTVSESPDPQSLCKAILNTSSHL